MPSRERGPDSHPHLCPNESRPLPPRPATTSLHPNVVDGKCRNQISPKCCMPDTAGASAPYVLISFSLFHSQRGGKSKRKDKCVPPELSVFGACIYFRKRQIDAERCDF